MSRSYPRWGGIESFGGHKPKGKYRTCCVCGAPSTRYGIVQHEFWRSADVIFGLCASNACRRELKAREGLEETPK